MTAPFLYTPTFAPVFNGQSVPNGLLYCYAAGTTNPKPTFADPAGIVPNANPVQLDVTGAATVRLEPGSYHFVLTDSTSTTVYWDQDFYRAPYLTAADIGSLLYANSSAELASGITPADLTYPEGDIRRYGALVGATDNSAAINAALAVSGAGGNSVYIPIGTWNCTSPIFAGSGEWSLRGEGHNSKLQFPPTCDGLVFAAVPAGLGRRVVKDLSLISTSISLTNKGIATSVSPAAAWNITFQNISIQNFGYMVYGNGFRNVDFIGLLGYDNNYGFYFKGQNVVVHLYGCDVIIRTQPTTGQSGISIQFNGNESTQGVDVVSCFFFNYKVNCDLIGGYDIVFVDTAFANGLVNSVQVSTVVQNANFSNCYIETQNTATTNGMLIVPQGTASTSAIHICNCQFTAITAVTGNVGLNISGANNNGVVAIDNQFFNFDIGIFNNAGKNCVFKNSQFVTTGTACIQLGSGALNCEVGPNFLNGTNGPELQLVTTKPAGLSYFSSGTFTITLSGMSSGGTGTVNWTSNGKIVTLSVPTAGIVGVSNFATMVGSGLPNYLWPVTEQTAAFNVFDSTAAVPGTLGAGVIGTGGNIVFKKDFNGSNFNTPGNTKGLNGFNSAYAAS